MAESIAREPTLWQRLHRWLFGDAARGERGVLNQDAPAAEAGDAPIITSHGEDPSHAHDPLHDA